MRDLFVRWFGESPRRVVVGRVGHVERVSQFRVPVFGYDTLGSSSLAACRPCVSHRILGDVLLCVDLAKVVSAVGVGAGSAHSRRNRYRTWYGNFWYRHDHIKPLFS